MILTQRGIQFINELLSDNYLVPPISVYLKINAGAPAGAGTIFASGTILFADPKAGNKTYIATSKEVLQLYNIVITPGPPPARPVFDETGGSTFDTLCLSFIANVSIEYGETIWQAPAAANPPAPFRKVWFKLDDASWDYDLILLESVDPGLYTYVTSRGYSAWDASAWQTLSDIPDCDEIEDRYAKTQWALLTGFGNVLPPHGFAAGHTPAFAKAPPSITFTPPIMPPNPASAPVTPVPPHAMQIIPVNPDARVPIGTVFLWPIPAAPGMPLIMYGNFAPIRKCSKAILLRHNPENTCLAADSGGGAIIPSSSRTGQPSEFFGVISGINGTIEKPSDWKAAWDAAITTPKRFDWNKMSPYIPWPYKNQVVTLITPMILNWPLLWPPVAEGYYRISIAQQSLALTFVTTNYPAADPTNAGQALNDVFGGKGKATNDSKFGSKNILHASSGVAGAAGSTTIFFTRNVDDDSKILISIQIVAIGRHIDAKASTCKSDQIAYKVEWVLDDTNTKNKFSGTPFIAGSDYCLI